MSVLDLLVNPPTLKKPLNHFGELSVRASIAQGGIFIFEKKTHNQP